MFNIIYLCPQNNESNSMKQPKLLYIVRHGETDFNRERIIQGSGVDTRLNATGHGQAKKFFERYQDIPFDVLITSKLRRTHETMHPFIEKGLPWEQFEEINEMNWGIHEGKKGTPEMIKSYQDMIAQWQIGNFDARLQEGESAAELAHRMQVFVDHVKIRPEEKILVCSHGRAMRCLMCVLKEQPLQKMEEYKHSNTGLYLVRFDGEQFHFELENDTSHLGN
jgi:broad specificity phosphatase PhoE